ncbi:MAG: type II toxin-antitoxin system RelE/ParE family toxin [Betaproteobacteria bacterium]|nr:type II toxin-antitoxin system RelE/ParE family toxin [Betaproteobacteria bacterium]
MSYQIEFFNPQVKFSIEAWPIGIAASFVRITQQMLISGPHLGMPYTRALRNCLFEIRAKGREGIGRAFYCAQIGQRIIILHGFIKKSKAKPNNELKIARKKLKEIRNE